MLKSFKELLRSKDDKELILAEENFDELMKLVEEDEIDLAKLEKHVREEFEDIKEDMEEMSEKITKMDQKKGVKESK